jgi:hypothetical protein
MDIFGSISPGTAKHVTVSGVSGAMSFSASAGGGSMIPDDMLITSVGYNGKAAVQVMHTLGALVYYYTFGVRDECAVITGVAFSRVCGGGQGGGQQIFSLASNFRKHARHGSVVSISAGDRSLRGLVDALRTTWSNPSMGMAGFELRMHLLGEGAASGSP